MIFLVENIVYDSITKKYWWVFVARGGNSSKIWLMSASSIEGGTWVAEKMPVISEIGHYLDAPCLAKFGDWWYIYYGRHDTINGESPGYAEIYAQRSNDVNKGYSEIGIANPILRRGKKNTDWDYYRVTEPYAFMVGNLYYLLYMGEMTYHMPERTGYAISSSPIGPFEKYAGNPVLGSDGRWNSGNVQAADPFVFKEGVIFYIGYTGSPILYGSNKQYAIGLATTKDFKKFIPNRSNPFIKGLRGALVKDNNNIYLSYNSSETQYRVTKVNLPK